MSHNTRATIRLLTPHNKTLVNSEFTLAHLPSTLSKDELTALFCRTIPDAELHLRIPHLGY